MTEKVRKMLAYLKEGTYKNIRRDPDMNMNEVIKDLDPVFAKVKMFFYMLDAEEAYICDYDDFGFRRTIVSAPYCVDENGKRFGRVGPGNVVPDYRYALENGMDAIAEELEQKKSRTADPAQKKFYTAALQSVHAALDFSDRYREAAKNRKKDALYRALCTVPHKRPQSFFEALVFMKFLQFTLRCNRTDHVTFGRFDQYIYPFYKSDLEKGVSPEALFEQLECFFISLNFDSDLYPGMQKGDNGQSMVLGGTAPDGSDCYNELSEACMRASLELCLIDPKINLRVSKTTPMERLEFATELTKQGLGFPQYCNDDVVIPGLMKLGYRKQDAYDYAVAACWEYITSGKGFDVPNIETMNFPLAVEKATKELPGCGSYEEFEQKVVKHILILCDELTERSNARVFQPSPYLSVFVDGCIESGRDIADCGAIYNNFGVHGAGISTAADSMAAIKKAVFKDKFCTAEELVSALDANFEGCDRLHNYLLNCPKMGNNDDYVDSIASLLMRTFADAMNGRKNGRGGIFRAGTGSAMKYIYSARQVGATADGRYAFAPFASSFSPSVTATLKGPLSCIRSFTKFDMTDIINGGPLTMEIHNATFRNDEGVKKVAALVKAFLDLGGHQLQLNSINREELLDAQKHPENHKNLIVRVWGWSGYFCELDRAFQDHIISRTEFGI